MINKSKTTVFLSIVSLAFTLLGGCSLDTLKPGVQATYDFGPLPEPAAEAEHWKRLALDVNSPHRFDKSGIAYRLSYVNPNVLYDYTESRWSASPVRLLQQRLEQRLGFGGVPGGCKVVLVVDEFAQQVEAPDKSTGIIQGRIYLIDGKRTIRGNLPLFQQAPAPTVDAAGAVEALSAASEQTVQAIDAWLRQLEQSDALAGC